MLIKNLTEQQISSFSKEIWHFYQQEGRKFPWREAPHNPYHIVVSEIMLQQTQTFRVVEKYLNFINRFPTFETLAQAPLRDLLAAWQGLGYNRRALFLQKSASIIMKEYAGILPVDPALLVELPGIGPATSCSISTFAFNTPTVFIETNIRAVFIHFFFKNEIKIPDSVLYPLVAETVDQKNPREWYYALMDYGVMLKKKFKNPSRKSAHHIQQSTFEGSDRQIRGMILKLLTQTPVLTRDEILDTIIREPSRVEKILDQLRQEGFIQENNNRFFISP